MKKRIFSLFLAVFLPVLFVFPSIISHAETTVDYIRDEIDFLTDDEENMLETEATRIAEEIGSGLYIVMVNDETQIDLVEGVKNYSEQNNIPSGTSAITLYLNIASANFISYYDENYISSEEVTIIEDDLLLLWSDGYYFNGSIHFLQTAERLILENQATTAEVNTTTATDGIEVSYVMDTAGLFTPEEVAKFEATISEFVEEENFGIYILTVDNFKDLYGMSDPWDTVTQFYRDKDLGVGEGRDGYILMLSMDDRDYANATYGDRGNSIFNSSAHDSVVDSALDDFSYNDWYRGFSDYIDSVMYEVGPGGEIFTVIMIVAGSFAVALLIGFTFKGQLKSVAKKHAASEYVPHGGVDMISSRDIFTHTTETRTKIVKSSGGSGSGSGRSGGGFSGGSGKF